MTDAPAIQLFVPKFRVDEVLAEIRLCLERGWTGLGYKTAEMEAAWVEYTRLPHAHFLNSATAALHIAVALYKRQLGWREGDEIISSPLTFVSTNHAILYEGLQPVFADVDESLCLDPASVETMITSRTRAVIFVGLGGNVGQLAAVADLCKRHNLKLILDAAHMAGTKLAGKDPGHLADVACYSFQAVKNLPTCDSGMICYHDKELDRIARQFSWMGISKDTFARAQKGSYSWLYDVDHIGFKYNGNSVVAAMGLIGLKYLDEDNAYRRQLCAWYDERLQGHSGVGRIPVPPDCTSSRHLYQIRVKNRDAMLNRLNEAGIYPGVHYRDNTEYGLYAYAQGSCPRAALASSELISLPLHLGLGAADIDRISSVILSQA